MGPKRRGAAGGSPAKSEPGASSGRSKLLKSALSNSIQGRRRGINNTLTEITNRTLEDVTPSLDTSADTTMRKKGRAMAQFKASQEEETPRTIVANFMEAHKEDAVNSSELFSHRRNTADDSLGASYSTRDRGSRHINANSLISDSSNLEDPTREVVADISNGSSPGAVGKHLKRKTGSRGRRNVTTDELDPDRDISRPTNRSMGDHTAQGTDSSLNETKAPPKRSRRTRARVNYSQNDFDFTNLTLRQDSHVSDTSPNESHSRQKKRPDNEDFDGLSPVAHAVGEVSPDQTRLAGKRPKVSMKVVDPSEFSNLTGEDRTQEQSSQGVEEDSMELTKMIPRRKRLEKKNVDTAEFSNISVGVEASESEQTLLKQLHVSSVEEVQTSETVFEGSMEETRVQPRRRTRKTAEIDAAEFTNISCHVDQSKIGTDSQMEVEETLIAAGGEETIHGGSMEETRVERRIRKQPKDVAVDVADFTDITVSAVKRGETILGTNSVNGVGDEEMVEEQTARLLAPETGAEEISGILGMNLEASDGVEGAQLVTSETFAEKEESRRLVERAARAARNPEIATVARSPCLSNIGEESEEGGHGSRQQSRATSRPPSAEMVLLPPDRSVAEATAMSPGMNAALRHARRSIYEAGQPEAPLEGTLSLGDSRMDPAGESTRLGGARSPQEELSGKSFNPTFAPLINSPAGAQARLSESSIRRTEVLEERRHGRSSQEEKNGGRTLFNSKGVVERAKSEVGIQYETPELERKARRESKRLSQSVLYHTRINKEEVAEQGTQMTPVGEVMISQVGKARLTIDPQVNETGVQVTPGLGEPSLEFTRADPEMVEEGAAVESVGLDNDDCGVEETEEKEKAATKKADRSVTRSVNISKSGEEEEVAKQVWARSDGMVEHLVEGKDVPDNDNVVEDDDMDTAAEKENLEEVASEQEEDVECEGEEGATSDHSNSEDDQDEDFDEEEDGDELQEEEEHDGAHGMADNDDAEKEMPPPGEHRFLPDSSTRRAMRHANLERYLGMADLTVDGRGLANIFTPESSPKETKVVKPKKLKEPIKTTFPAKKTIQQFNRFSRYKLKKEAEDLVLDASEDFVELAMARLKKLSKNRGDSKIHLCDIRRYMTECGFLLPVEEDFMDLRLYEQIRELQFCDEELQWELIPMQRVMGRTYPPEDIWKEPDLSSKANHASSASKKKGPKKADSARRLKVPRNSKGGFLDDNSDEEENGKSREVPKGKGKTVSVLQGPKGKKTNVRKGKN